MSDSNVQPMEQRPQTPRPQNVGLPHTTHGTSTLNCLTPTSNPWNEGLKLSDSHVQPMEQRLQTVVSGEKHSLLVSLSACPFMVMTRPGQKDTSNLMF